MQDLINELYKIYLKIPLTEWEDKEEYHKKLTLSDAERQALTALLDKKQYIQLDCYEQACNAVSAMENEAAFRFGVRIGGGLMHTLLD